MRYVGLDLSTKTGVVVLDKDGSILEQKEIINDCDTPESMKNHILETMNELQDTDFVVIEGFGYASKTGFLLGGIGWGVRMALFERNIKFKVIAPTALKKFATGSGKADKRKLAVEVNKRWGFFHDSDNVTDAFVLAEVARSLKEDVKLTAFQKEVLKKIG